VTHYLAAMFGHKRQVALALPQCSQIVDQGGDDFSFVAESLAMHLSDGIDIPGLFLPDVHRPPHHACASPTARCRNRRTGLVVRVVRQ
jgi:hypothetical protein